MLVVVYNQCLCVEFSLYSSICIWSEDRLFDMNHLPTALKEQHKESEGQRQSLLLTLNCVQSNTQTAWSPCNLSLMLGTHLLVTSVCPD